MNTMNEYWQYCKRIRKQEMSYGRCFCPRNKWQFCDGICCDCEFHRSEEFVSLETPVIANDDMVLLQDTIPDLRPSAEYTAMIHDLLIHTIQYLRMQDPDADSILSMWMDHPDIDAQTVAQALGRPQRTFAHQLER